MYDYFFWFFTNGNIQNPCLLWYLQTPWLWHFCTPLQHFPFYDCFQFSERKKEKTRLFSSSFPWRPTRVHTHALTPHAENKKQKLQKSLLHCKTETSPNSTSEVQTAGGKKEEKKLPHFKMWGGRANALWRSGEGRANVFWPQGGPEVMARQSHLEVLDKSLRLKDQRSIMNTMTSRSSFFFFRSSSFRRNVSSLLSRTRFLACAGASWWLAAVRRSRFTISVDVRLVAAAATHS